MIHIIIGYWCSWSKGTVKLLLSYLGKQTKLIASLPWAQPSCLQVPEVNDLMTAKFYEFQAFLDWIKVNHYSSLLNPGSRLYWLFLTLQGCISRFVVMIDAVLPLIWVGKCFKSSQWIALLPWFCIRSSVFLFFSPWLNYHRQQSADCVTAHGEMVLGSTGDTDVLKDWM